MGKWEHVIGQVLKILKKVQRERNNMADGDVSRSENSTRFKSWKNKGNFMALLKFGIR